MKALLKQLAGILGAAFAAACCLGISVILSAVGAAGIGFIAQDAYLFPIFVAFVTFSAWMLFRSARGHGNLAPFWLGVAGALVGVVGLWLLVTGVYAHAWTLYVGLAVLVGGSVWDAIPVHKPAACACETDAAKPRASTGKRAAAGVAAAGAFYAMYRSVEAIAPAARDGEIACWGINSCKGTTACTTAFNACTGQNSCKGRGYLNVPPRRCALEGGVLLEGSEGDPKR